MSEVFLYSVPSEPRTENRDVQSGRVSEQEGKLSSFTRERFVLLNTTY